ncbi:hypothetical protein NW768_002504 [Fusarium equiseti]|uniref:F-box domain-containing protein n=1 Tax=Fusarium equiseti TaxID=61235 RepID=A0ABQ8RNN2_FUSEQ|nr:hypothetical protein NW768_002504 [Fusarium equiseti]
MEETNVPTGTDWSPPRLPNEIYRLIISQINDFYDSSRKPTLVAVVHSCKLFNRIGEEYLYSQSPRFGEDGKAAEFLHRLRLQPKRALYVRSLFYNYDDLTELSTQCSNLQELELFETLTLSEDLEQACKNWGSTLRMLKLRSIVELSDWIVQIMPHMTTLTTLVLDRGCTISMEDIEAIAESKAPLQQVTLAGLCCPQDEAAEESEDEADEDTNDAIANMVTAHSSTLRHLILEYTKVGPHVLESCKKAKKLRTLDFQLAYRPSAAEIDDLLEACPYLSGLRRALTCFSLREDEWKTRPTTEVPEATFEC